MSLIVNYPHLTRDEPGAVRIGRTRYKVIHLASEHYHYVWSAEELMRQHPDLQPEEVYAALTYFYDHYDSPFAHFFRSFENFNILYFRQLQDSPIFGES
jgi:uncharacterized protein (DUF433 family)